jgi:uncharacterized repeat protein (TIGR01451 family)
MKTKLTLVLLLCGIMQLLGVSRANAQSTSVSITYAGDSTWMGCNVPPASVFFYVGGMASGYNSTDPMTIQIFFGDGHDTTITTGNSPNGFWASADHIYTIAGLYSVQFIATGVDGNADTVTYYNSVAIGYACGNLSGNVYQDANGNCMKDANETGATWLPVNLSYNNQVIQTSWTDNNGDYFFSVPTGFTYEVSIGSNYSGYVTSCPASGSYTVSSLPSVNDFGMTCSNVTDLWVYTYGWGYRPGFNGSVYIDYGNASCNTANAQVQLALDPLVSYVSATPAPSSISGNILTWNLNNLNNTSVNSWINVSVYTSLTANIGDTVCNQATITPLSGDANPSNNTALSCNDVRNSWDPNMKEVSPKGIGAQGNVAPNTTFTYTVHFQNTGSDVAYNIYVLDTLDSDLDPSSLKVLSYSHNMQMSLLPGNIMKFDFLNIMLADSTSNEPMSHGYVTYQVKAKTGLANGTQFENTAHIYFDFNPAIVTNTTLNTIDIALGVNDMENSAAIGISPNPASDVITLSFTGVTDNSEVQLVDITGRVIASEVINAASAQMSVSSVPAGVYMISVKRENGTIQQRLVVVH